MTTSNTYDAWIERLTERPGIFPHQLNLVNDSILLAEISPEEVASASFLDQRILKQTTRGNWVPWRLVADAVEDAPAGKPAGFIFHVGHCGSTLLSRLLAFADSTQSLREPLPLRVLAQDLADSWDGRSFLDRRAQRDRLRVLMKLWCRGARHTVIKATSVCTDLISQVNRLEPETKSVFVYNRPDTHIATLLAGQNALVDLKGFAKLRLQRLQHSTGLDIHLSQLSLAQLAALSWLSETSSIVAALRQGDDKLELLEFESLLKDPAEKLTSVLKHLDIETDAASVDKAVRSPVLQTYSKAPEHQYNARTRAAILADARSRFQVDIKATLGWMDSLANQSEIVAAAMRRFS